MDLTTTSFHPEREMRMSDTLNCILVQAACMRCHRTKCLLFFSLSLLSLKMVWAWLFSSSSNLFFFFSFPFIYLSPPPLVLAALASLYVTFILLLRLQKCPQWPFQYFNYFCLLNQPKMALTY